ncbi:hypothetical protein N7448_008222 [Penicillium atrosanguineum]|nr:hypothetical protein N7448_008222 [Penicillium atrosanguineum]
MYAFEVRSHGYQAGDHPAGGKTPEGRSGSHLHATVRPRWNWVDEYLRELMAPDSPEYGLILVSVSIALSVLQIIFVALMFYTRRLQREKYGWDAWIMLIALFGSLAKAGIYIAMVYSAGLGRHIADMKPPSESFIFIKKGYWAVELFDFPLTITPAKISLLLFYVRIFYTRKFKFFAYGVGFLVMGLGIAMFFQTIFQCSPVGFGWHKTNGHGSCIDQMFVYRVISPINVLTGVLILTMPMPLVWRLHAPRGQKLALTAVFLIGGLGTVVSIWRVFLYFAYSKSQLHDVTWFSLKISILTVIEGAILIITPCLVSIWPLLTRMVPRRLIGKLTCYRQARQHRQWYMTSHMPENSPCGDSSVRVRRDGRLGSSGSLADLEDQLWWVSDDTDTTSTCERIIVDNDSKD